MKMKRRRTAEAALETLGPARMWMLDRLQAFEAEGDLEMKLLSQTSRDTVCKDSSRRFRSDTSAQTHREVSKGANPASPKVKEQVPLGLPLSLSLSLRATRPQSEATNGIGGNVGCYRSIISQVCAYTRAHTHVCMYACMIRMYV